MKVSFFSLTNAQYSALETKNDNALYFITDKNTVMKGSVRYSHPTEFVTAYPSADIKIGVLYVSTSASNAKVYDGESWISVGPSISQTISGEGETDSVPSTRAVINYVSALTGGLNDALISASISGKNLVTKKVDGTTNTYSIVGFVDGVTYDGSTHVLSFAIAGGSPVTINLPADNFLSAANYNPDSHILTMTMVDSSTVTVNLEDLIDAYTVKTVADNDTVALSMNSNVISAALRISANTGNRVEIKSDGIYVSKESVGSTNVSNILIADANGNMSSSNVKIGSGTFKSTPDASTAATELGVQNYVSAQVSGIASAVEWQTIS